MAKIIKPKSTEVELTSVQICLELKIIGDYKRFVEKKYKNKSYIKAEWIERLNKDGISL